MSIKQWLNRLWGRVPADPVDRVEANRKGLVIHLGRESYMVPWGAVKSIAVHFVTGSPESKDTHYLLALPERELRISLDTPGMREFTDHLQNAPGVKHGVYRDALKSFTDIPMVIWENPEDG